MIQRKRTLSPSALSTLYRCGEQYRRRYVLRDPTPTETQLVVGGAVDSVVNHVLQARLDDNEMPEVQEVADMARRAVEIKWQMEEIRLRDDEIEKGLKVVKQEAIEKAVDLAVLHRTEVAPQIKPTHIQRRFRLEAEGYPFDLTGVIDIQADDDGKVVVRDTKTSAKSPNKDAAHASEQLTFYALGVEVEDGEMPAKVALDYLVRTPTGKLHAVTLESFRTMEDLKVLIARIERGMEVITKGQFAPADPSNWVCSERWCSYWDSCKFARRPVSVAVPA